jgi:hypothetical protein
LIAAGIKDLLRMPFAWHSPRPALDSGPGALGEHGKLVTHTFQVGAHGMKYSPCGRIVFS